MTQINTLVLCMDTPLKSSELARFRGAVNAVISSHNILFHNHNGQYFRYAYPLIQYKCLAGKAAIVAIGEGVVAMEELLQEPIFLFDWGNVLLHYK